MKGRRKLALCVSAMVFLAYSHHTPTCTRRLIRPSANFPLLLLATEKLKGVSARDELDYTSGMHGENSASPDTDSDSGSNHMFTQVKLKISSSSFLFGVSDMIYD